MTTFESDYDYMASEMARVRERAEAHISARESGDLTALRETLEGMRTERAAVREARRRIVDDGAELSFEFLVRRYQLDAEEEDMLLLGCAAYLSNNTHRLLLHAQGDLTKPHVELGFAAELVRPDLLSQRKLTSPESKLLQTGLLRLLDHPYTHSPARLTRPVVAPQYVAAAALGEMRLDSELTRAGSIRQPTNELFEIVLNPGPRRIVERLIRGVHARGGGPLPGPLRVLVTGPVGSGKTLLAQALASSRKQPLLSIDAAQLGPAALTLTELARHNATFAQAVWHVERPEALLRLGVEHLRFLQAQALRFPGLVIVETSQPRELEDTLGELFDFRVDLETPDAQRRQELWESAIPTDVAVAPDLTLTQLARTYELTGRQIGQAVNWAMRVRAGEGSETLAQEHLTEGASAQLRSRLGELTAASRVTLSMNDLVLPARVMRDVQEFLAACRNRDRLLSEWGFGERLVTGKGLVALFLGEAGTGKTLTAEILAGELGLKLNIVSIPKVVSKWVGETEKNLRQVFSQARANNSMLLFDEADALFARRVKVERSSDHFQNMEVNNLLQEIERFEGIVVLTTNLEANMDPAFARRILYRVEFPMPGPKERAAIWQKLIPAAVPLGRDVDFTELGELYELTGGQIKNAVVRASYQSLDDRVAMSQERLEAAAQQQAMSAGRLVRA